MNIIFHLLILNLCKIIINSIVVLPFEINQINFKDNKYSATELIKILFEVDYYTTIKLSNEKQRYFGIISFNDHHPILSSLNCEKKNKFNSNKNIVKNGFLINKSKTKKYLGKTTDYLNTIKFVEFYSEQFWYYNETLLEENRNINTNLQMTEIFLILDNTNIINPEMCLSIGLNDPFKVYSNPSPPHFIDDLRSKNKIDTQDWTIKFTGPNKGQLIIGNLPHLYEKDNIKYSEDNYTTCNSECIITFFQPWGIEMKEIFFNNNTNNKIIVNKNNNKFVLVHNFGFIIGSNNYKNLIYRNYFQDLIAENICVLEKSDITKYNQSHYFIKTEGDYFMYICSKEKMNNVLKKFPTLFFSNIKYEYIFELTYNDLFKEINNYYYFMIIFPNTKQDEYDFKKKEEWHLGLPFLLKYQFVFNFDYKSIGFYKFKNFEQKNIDSKEKSIDNNNINNKNISKIWLIILEILIILLIIIVSFFIGKYVSRQRKKRANELKDEDFEYIEDNFKENDNKLIN